MTNLTELAIRANDILQVVDQTLKKGSPHKDLAHSVEQAAEVRRVFVANKPFSINKLITHKGVHYARSGGDMTVAVSQTSNGKTINLNFLSEDKFYVYGMNTDYADYSSKVVAVTYGSMTSVHEDGVNNIDRTEMAFVASF